MIPNTLSSLLILVAVRPLALASAIRRAQITFPPASGPCRQNVGLEPLQCTDKDCLDIPASGVCNIQTQDGLPICGCCDSSITMLCSACGGDAGNGICNGSGSTNIAYQGCQCSSTEGTIPNHGQSNACPEDLGVDPQACSAASCGGATKWDGICDLKTIIDGPYYTFCSCCPAQTLPCADCGGDQGNKTCNGVEQYTGMQYRNCKCDPDASGNHPVIIPFPVPPPGFPPPPLGTPNPEETCSTAINTECSDCSGKNNWCQVGEHAGCPCKDDEPKCPQDDDTLDCADTACDGAKNTSAISQCLGTEDDRNRDCTCTQFPPLSDPYAPFTDLEAESQQVFLAVLAALDVFPDPTSTTSAATPAGTGKLTCYNDNAASIPSSMEWMDGEINPNQVLYALRQVICTNSCQAPDGLPNGVAWATGSKTTGDCEVAVSIAGNIEAYIYRGTPSIDSQWQQCWDSTQAIIEECVQNKPNKGWVNGPNEYQFYEGGFRPLNDASVIHDPMHGDALQPSIAQGAVAPSKLGGITCGNDAGGVKLVSCLNILGSLVGGEVLSASDTNESICTSGSTCLSTGKTVSADGETTYGEYCEVAEANGCSVVLATKDSSFGGFPGKSCVSPAALSEFIRLGANQCGANQVSGVWAAGFKGGDEVAGTPYTVLGLVDAARPGIVFVP